MSFKVAIENEEFPAPPYPITTSAFISDPKTTSQDPPPTHPQLLPTTTTANTTSSSNLFLDDFINWTLVQMVLDTLIDLYLIPRIPGNLEDGLGNSLVLQYLSGYAVHGLCLSLCRVLTGRWFPPFGRLINVIFIFPLWTRVHVNGTVRLLVDYSWVGAPPYLATYHSRYKVASE